MKIKFFIGRLIPGIIGLLAFLVWFYIDKESLSLTQYSPETLAKRWCEIAAYLGLLFGLISVTLLFAFRKRMKPGAIVLTILNVTTAWAFVTLYFIFSDRLAYPAFVQLGIIPIRWLFLLGGVAWSIVAFYLFARTVDASPAR
jgi:hypothetical protein